MTKNPSDGTILSIRNGQQETYCDHTLCDYTMLNHPALRKSFEFLAQNAYLNTASTGLSWPGLGSAAAEFYDTAKSCGSTAREQWSARLDDTKARLAALLGVAE